MPTSAFYKRCYILFGQYNWEVYSLLNFSPAQTSNFHNNLQHFIKKEITFVSHQTTSKCAFLTALQQETL